MKVCVKPDKKFMVFSNLQITQPVKLNAFDAIGGALGQVVDLAAVDLGQQPISNCYGGVKFC